MKIVLLGFGNVGRGFVRVFLKHQTYLKKFGDLKIAGIYTPSKGIVFDNSGIDMEKALNCRGKFSECFKSSNIRSIDELIQLSDIMIDVSPTNFQTGEPSCTYIKRALESGIRVITANKGPIALCFRELEKFGPHLRYEATVMSGTPLISYLKENFIPSEIAEIQGILNGTTNFILTRIAQGMSFEEALNEAIDKGIAEKDPSADLEGLDVLFKITILANAVMEGNLHPSDVPVRGIKDIPYPTQGKKWKLIARAFRVGNEVMAEVKPIEIDSSNPFFNVDGTDNAVLVKSGLPGNIFLRGPGAGGETTGYGIFLDLVKILEV